MVVSHLVFLAFRSRPIGRLRQVQNAFPRVSWSSQIKSMQARDSNSHPFRMIRTDLEKGLACVCDIATAFVPQFLLWNVQMRTRTKRQLNFLFGLGLITAALSIARAAIITKKSLTEDSTCKSSTRLQNQPSFKV